MDRARRRRAHPAAVRTPPQLAAGPADLYPRRGLRRPLRPADRSTPAEARIEDRLALAFDCHKCQVEQRRWYGCAPSPRALSIGFGTDWSGLAEIQNLALVDDRLPG
ncbi:exo-rhamnogalacturonan lyase family protein [Streptomyces malaysiensis]|uniref:exo-rhamnogalacturonan lyase family protein n=1 Tax=Streptomyces malaysiensis TaxID=92644 RepID=UPI002B2DDC64|nr:hypothetical protein R8789_10705 [Streptomyces malaysiensis]